MGRTAGSSVARIVLLATLVGAVAIGCGGTQEASTNAPATTAGTTAPGTSAPGTSAPGTTASTTTTAPATSTTVATTTPTTAAVGPTDAVVGAAAKTATPGVGTYTLTVANASGTPLVTAQGKYIVANGQSSATLDMGGLAQAVASTPGTGAIFASFLRDPIDAVTVGDSSFLRWSIIAQLAGASTQWIQIAAPPGASTVGLPTTDASGLLAGMGGATGATMVGPEAVNGAPATKYTVTVDTQKALATAPANQKGTLQKLLGLIGSPASVTFDVWVGADGTVKRIQTPVPTTTLMTAIGGTTVASLIGPQQLGPTLLFTVDYTRSGTPVAVTVPAPTDVTVVDAAQLAKLVGGGK